MSEKLLSDMNYCEFETLINAYIDRSSHQYDEMPASSFLEILFHNVAQRATETVEIEGRIIEGKLMFELPKIPLPNVYIQDNQILIGTSTPE